MYLPNSLYERAPHYWLFVGLLLIILGIYLGIQVDTKFTVVGVGLEHPYLPVVHMSFDATGAVAVTRTSGGKRRHESSGIPIGNGTDMLYRRKRGIEGGEK